MSQSIRVTIDFGDRQHCVGELLFSEKMNRFVFAYDKSFLASGYQISPLDMPLSEKTYQAEYRECFHGLHGVFADSLPDAWGMQVQNLEFEKIGLYEPSIMDRLAFIGKYSMGALRYEPCREFEKREEILKYADLRKATQHIIHGDVETVSEELLLCGGSAGGARPKFLVDIKGNDPLDIRYSAGKHEDGYIPVLMKVPSKDSDLWQRAEYAHSKLAEIVGIKIPVTYLIQGERNRLAYFAIRRFDVLENNERLHTSTFAGLINEEFGPGKHDYGALLRVTEMITKDHAQVIEAYRRMVFNYLACNKDDHAKNFSFCMDKDGQWSLAPAYDVGFSKGAFNCNAMSVNGKFVNPTVRDFRMVAEEFRIKDWKEILAKTIDTVMQYPVVAETVGLDKKNITRVYNLIKEQVDRVGKDLKTGR